MARMKADKNSLSRPGLKYAKKGEAVEVIRSEGHVYLVRNLVTGQTFACLENEIDFTDGTAGAGDNAGVCEDRGQKRVGAKKQADNIPVEDGKGLFGEQGDRGNERIKREDGVGKGKDSGGLQMNLFG